MKPDAWNGLLIAVLYALMGVVPVVAAPSTIELKPCAVEGLEGEFRCGTLEVPEDPARQDGRRIGLNVLVVPALKPPGGTRAVVFTVRWAGDGGHRGCSFLGH